MRPPAIPPARSLRAWLVWASCLALAACAGSSPSQEETGILDHPCGGALEVQIGSSESDWSPLSPGDPVTMVHGPQGGWHMLGSVYLTNTAPIVEIQYQITTTDGVSISNNTYRIQLVEDGECSGYFPGMYGYLNVNALASGEADTPPELLSNAPVIMQMQAVDESGRTGEASMQITAVPDPADVE